MSLKPNRVMLALAVVAVRRVDRRAKTREALETAFEPLYPLTHPSLDGR